MYLDLVLVGRRMKKMMRRRRRRRARGKWGYGRDGLQICTHARCHIILSSIASDSTLNFSSDENIPTDSAIEVARLERERAYITKRWYFRKNILPISIRSKLSVEKMANKDDRLSVSSVGQSTQSAIVHLYKNNIRKRDEKTDQTARLQLELHQIHNNVHFVALQGVMEKPPVLMQVHMSKNLLYNIYM